MTRKAPVAWPLPPKASALLAALGGTLYFLGFAGFDIWPLSFVAYIPTFFALYKQPPGRAAWLGWLAGTVMGVGGFYWLQSMLVTFSGFPAPICALFTVIVCAFQGGRWALHGWLFARMSARAWPTMASFAAAFATSELVYPLLFPWYFGGSVHQVPLLLQTAELGGAILVSLVLLSVNLALCELVLAKLESRPFVRVRLAAPAAFVTFSVLFGAWRIRSVDQRVAAAPAVRVGTVQANMGLLEKRTNYNEGMRRHLAATNDLKARGAEVIVWSETSATRPVHIDDQKTMIPRLVGELIRVPAIVGVVLYREDKDRGMAFYNSAVSLDAKGQLTGRFDKTYLLMFGEYLPFGETFPILYKWSPNSGKFTPGKSLDPLYIEHEGVSHVVTTLICYEDIIPAFTRAAVRHANPELLVNITNDAWFGDTTEPWEHFALAKFRAVEHRKYLVRSTNSGVSAIVDPVGRVVANTKTMAQGTLLATIHWMKGGTTLYGWIGDAPWWLLAVGAVLAGFRSRRTTEVAAAAAKPSAQSGAD